MSLQPGVGFHHILKSIKPSSVLCFFILHELLPMGNHSMVLVKLEANIADDESDALSESLYFPFHFHDHGLNLLLFENRESFADI